MLSKVDSLLGCPSIDNSIESKLSFTDSNQKRFFCWCLVGEETVDWPVLLPHEWFGELWERSLQLWSKYVLGTNEHAAIGKFWETVANSPLAGAAPDGKPGLIKMLLWKVLTNC